MRIGRTSALGFTSPTAAFATMVLLSNLRVPIAMASGMGLSKGKRLSPRHPPSVAVMFAHAQHATLERLVETLSCWDERRNALTSCGLPGGTQHKDPYAAANASGRKMATWRRYSLH